MQLVEILLTACAITLVAMWWTGIVVQRPTIGCGVVGVAAAAAGVALITGLRWQLVPAFVVCLLLAGAMVKRLLDGPKKTGLQVRKRISIPAALVAGLLIAVSVVSSWAIRVVNLPEPSGQWAVGTTTAEWVDADRDETNTADPDDKRLVVAKIWYPAQSIDPESVATPYLGRTDEEAQIVAEAITDGLGVPTFVVNDSLHARSSSFFDAPVATAKTRFPVVLYSHGFGGGHGRSTAWAEDLASRGYIVVSLDHPYESLVVIRENGERIHGTFSLPTEDGPGRDKLVQELTLVRAEDLSFALDRIEADDVPHGLRGRLDTDKVAVSGHSMGGAAAVTVGQQDTRFDAIINYDGWPQSLATKKIEPPMLVYTQDFSLFDENDFSDEEKAVHHKALAVLEDSLELNESGAIRLEIEGAAHLTFSDAPFQFGKIPPLVGSMDADVAHRYRADSTVRFLESVFSGETISRVAKDLEEYGEVDLRS